METSDKLIPLGDLTWPLTYVWRMSVPWGLAEMHLTAEVPSLANDAVATAASVEALWKAAIAPAISLLTTLIDCSVHVWKLGASFNGHMTFPTGTNGIFPLGPSRGITVVMHTGHSDRRARRRLIFPTCPRGWCDSLGQITPDGAERMISHVRGMMMGLSVESPNGPMTWLNVYPAGIPNPITGFGTPGFRVVRYARLCQYAIPVPVAL